MMLPASFDRVKTYLKRIIDDQTRRIDFMALYPCKVVAQNGDNSLELQPDSANLPAYSRVPLRLGIPGATAKVAAGSRVLLGFEGGDPRAPIGTLWDKAVLTELDIGASPTSYIALATQTKAALDAIVSAFNSHVHTSAAAGSPTTTPMTPPAIPLSVTVSTAVASATVKST